MFANFDVSVIVSSLPYLFGQGMVFTLTLTALAASGGIVFGTALAMMRRPRCSRTSISPSS